MDIVMISGACCIPSMSGIDNAARKVVDEAISMAGVQAKVSMITASTAYGIDAYRKIIAKGIGMSDAPIILIDGEVISLGIPQIEVLKKAMIEYSKKSKEN